MPNVEFRGYLPQAEVYALYAAADALIFPSKLESWGLPMSEFRRFGKPVFAADLPYAKETLSGYEQACFFAPDDAAKLAELLRRFSLIREFPAQPARVEYRAPVAENWPELMALIGLN